MPLAAGDPLRSSTLAAALAVMVGLICVTGGLARLGFLADLLQTRPRRVHGGCRRHHDGQPAQQDRWRARRGRCVCPRSGPGRATSTRSTGLPCCARPCLPALLFPLQWLVPLALGPLFVVVLGAVVVTVFS